MRWKKRNMAPRTFYSLNGLRRSSERAITEFSRKTGYFEILMRFLSTNERRAIFAVFLRRNEHKRKQRKELISLFSQT